MRARVAVLLGGLISFSLACAAPNKLSDAEIVKRIISESIAGYPGPCACPFNAMKNGSACGRRSAYSKPGGYSPICYAEDVTQDDIVDFKVRLSKR